MLMLRALVRDGVGAAPRPADVDRRRPPRRALLLRPVAGGVPDRWRFAARRRRPHRPGRHRGRARDVVAGALDRGTRRRGSWPGSRWPCPAPPSRSPRSSGTRTSSPCPARSRSAGAWRAWSTGRPVWWLLAALGTALTMQFHVLGVTMLPIVGALLVADARSRPAGPERRRVWRYGLGGLAIVALSFTPLVIHELTTDFSEVDAALAYIRAGGDPSGARTAGATARDRGARPVVAADRAAHRRADGRAARDRRRRRHRRLAGARRRLRANASRRSGSVSGSSWTAFALTFISPSLATVVPGLPNDHYHAFADPMVFALVGMGAAALWRVVPPIGPVATVVGCRAPSSPGTSRRGRRRPPPTAATRRPSVPRRGSSQPPGRTSSPCVRCPTSSRPRRTPIRSIRAGATVTRRHRHRPARGDARDGRRHLRRPVRDRHRRACGGPAEATVAPPDRFGEPDRPLRSRPRPDDLDLPGIARPRPSGVEPRGSKPERHDPTRSRVDPGDDPPRSAAGRRPRGTEPRRPTIPGSDSSRISG